MDHLTAAERSLNMSKIRNKDSELEISFRKALWGKGLRYRKNVNGMKGKPDLVLKKKKSVIFIDSCFWHHCPKHGHFPKSNLEYWGKKLSNNRKRDIEVEKYYRSNGWKIVRIWEHDLIFRKLNITINRTVKTINAS